MILKNIHNTNNKSSLQDFHIHSKLAAGTFSTVYKVLKISNQTYYALKKVNSQ